MARVAPRSFGEKISLLLTMTSGGIVLVVAGVLAIFDLLDSNRELHERIDTHARIVALDGGPALAFEDRADAMAALRALHAVRDVGSATLFDTDKQIFVRYRRAQNSAPDFPDTSPGISHSGFWRVVTLSVRDRGGDNGHLQVAVDLRPLWLRALYDALLVIAVTIAAATVVNLLSRQLRGVLLDPVTELALKARAVSQTGNYAIRAVKFSDDELGQFTDVFNEMLSQIQRQDAEIKAARRNAEHASQMKDEFLATLSHELRTPMTPILGWAQALKFAAGDNAQVREAATVIERNARIQTQIVDDLLDMSRIVSGKVQLNVEPVAIAEVVDAAVATVSAAAVARGIDIEVVHAPGSIGVSADPGRLQQVFWNLLANAVKFTDSGGRVAILSEVVGTQVRIRVHDSGQGIEAAFLPLVFERFRQADSSITRRHGGLGVGLAIVKQLIELHGGSVFAESPGPGHGATFTVVLPLLSGDVTRAQLANLVRSSLPDLLQGLTAFVVDDQTDSRELLVHLLEASGARTYQANSVEKALLQLDELSVDILVSDIAMPGQDGYDLIRSLRARAPKMHPRLPALAITAFARSDDGERIRDAGFDAYLPKPIDQVALVETVARLAGRKPKIAEVAGEGDAGG